MDDKALRLSRISRWLEAYKLRIIPHDKTGRGVCKIFKARREILLKEMEEPRND